MHSEKKKNNKYNFYKISSNAQCITELSWFDYNIINENFS